MDKQAEALAKQLRANPSLGKGKVARWNAKTNRVELVPWHQSDTKPGTTGDSLEIRHYEVEFDPREVFTDLPDVKKRSPQERVASLTKRLVDHYNQSGDIPLELCEMIAKEYERLGMRQAYGTPITGESLRILAAAMLEEADKKDSKTLRHQIGGGVW